MNEPCFGPFQSKFDALRNEHHICQRKLDSKTEALLILSKELDQCRSERDQFKLMAEQLRDRYQAMKKQLYGRDDEAGDNAESKSYIDMQNRSLVKLLCDTKERNKSQQFHVEDLKQKLHDAQGDIKLLREQLARQRVGTSDEGMNTRHFPAYEREDLVKQLEASREQYVQLERDLQQVLDEKEEQVTERDAYRTKYERLNQELNYILKGDENRIVDIDALVMENKYLLERLKQMEEEKSIAIATVSKYKNLLEKKKMKGGLKLGQSRSGGLVITQKQVQQILDNRTGVPATPQALADLQSLAGALLDTINDKNLALSHQRKTNKILGNRVSELEKKLKTLEMAGLWNVPVSLSNLEKLREDCNDIKTLIPTQSSAYDDASNGDSERCSVSSTSSVLISPTHNVPQDTKTNRQTLSLAMEDLDLLPTKEEPDMKSVTASCNSTQTSHFLDGASLISPDIKTDAPRLYVGTPSLRNKSDVADQITPQTQSRLVNTSDSELDTVNLFHHFVDKLTENVNNPSKKQESAVDEDCQYDEDANLNKDPHEADDDTDEEKQEGCPLLSTSDATKDLEDEMKNVDV